jgi:diguanylate cyclase (GGDEF)-like protein/PAS domain S-box-containing protein
VICLEAQTRRFNLLYDFSLLIRNKKNNLEELLVETARIMPSAFRYPESTCACIEYGGQQYSAGKCQTFSCCISFPLELHDKQVGLIKACYHEQLLRGGEFFLEKEKLVLELLSHHINRVIERNEIERVMKEDREKISITLNSIGDGVIATDLQGIITRFNYQAGQLTGWKPEEALGRPLEEVFRVVTARTGKPLSTSIHRVTRNGKTVGFKSGTTLVAQDGTRRRIADKAAPIRDPDGNILGAIIVFTDVTEQYQSELALKNSEERLNTILSNTMAVIYSYKIKQGRPVVTYINQNVKNVIGFEPDEIMQNPRLWRNSFHPEDVSIIKTNTLHLLKNKEPVHFEYRFKHKKGHYLWLSEYQKIIDSEEGDMEIVVVCREITERKQAEILMEARLNLLSFSYKNSLEALLQKTINEACEVLESPLGFYHFVSEDEKMLSLVAWSKDTLKSYCKANGKSKGQYPLAKAGVWADCVRLRRPVIHNDYASLPNRKGMPGGHVRVIRELVVPIMRQGRIVAMMGVGNKKQDYTEQDVQIASFLADIAWSIVEQKQREEKISYMSFHDILTGLYNRAFLEEEMQRLDTKRQLPIGMIMADLNGLKLVNDAYGHLVGDEMLKSVARILEKSCRKEDIIARWGGDEFIILLPQTSEKVVNSVYRRIKRGCEGAYVKDVPISLALGFALKNNISRNLDDVIKEAENNMYKQKLAERRSIRSGVLQALLKTLGAKSFETEEHTQRMQGIALKIGERLGLSDPEMARLSLLITLHDIGKINIPEEILTKKGPLTKQEWEIIKKHPEIGFRIARATEDFAHVAEEILAHHERWDGTGYPRGLKGEKIPLLSRIASLADTYEVISNGRPYREPLSHDEAIEEIKKCSGSQFDPDLVTIVLDILGKSADDL